MRKQLQNYFIFSRRERRAAWLLLCLVLMLLILPDILHALIKKPDTKDNYALWQSLKMRTDTTSIYQSDHSFRDSNSYAENYNYPFQRYKTEQQNVELSFITPSKPFNPNMISAEEWQSFGVPKYVAERIIKYRQKSGTFKSSTDVKKIYGFPDDVFATIEPFMIFQDSSAVTVADHSGGDLQIVLTSTNLNTCTKEDLLSLGFSPNDATRILRFREQAGGIYDSQQLFGVYGIDADKLQELIKWLEVDKNSVIKINLNTIDSTTLANHIYISDILAGSIIRYREATGKFYSVNELLKVKGMYPALFEKLKPYLQL